MTDPSRPPDVWGDEPDDPPRGGSAPLPPGDPALDHDRSLAGRPLDPAGDPDRFDPSAERPVEPVLPPPRLDPAGDPDRYRGGDRTLTEMLGEGAQEDTRDNYVWLLGLLSMLVFLGLVALIAANLGP